MTTLKTDTDKDIESSRDITDPDEPLTAEQLISQDLELSMKIDKLSDLSIRPDITIHCKDGIKFQIHKGYLLAASKHFRAEICSEVSKSDFIKLDYKSQTIFPFLVFIYTGKLVIKDPDQACKVFRFSATYNFNKLKIRAAECMALDINFTNVCKYYFLGRRYQSVLLRRNAQMFYSKHCAEIDGKHPDWDKEYPKSARILRKLQKNKITLIMD